MAPAQQDKKEELFSELYAEEDAGGKIMTMGENGQMVEYLGPSVDEIEEKEPESLDLNMGESGQKVWLVKLPKRLADQWKDMDKVGGKDLGKLRIKNGNGNDVKLVLDPIAGVTDNLPMQYRINMNKNIIENEYIFTEQNLKNFKSERTEVANLPQQPELQDLNDGFDSKLELRRRRLKRLREMKMNNGEDSNNKPRYIPYVKTIPKKTALVGTVYHECQVVPSMTDKNYIRQLKKDLKLKPRQSAILLQDAPGLIQSNSGPSITKGNTSQFLRQDKFKVKSDGRATRMPEKELLDLLFSLFDEYDYWTMKGLKERTRQPETYLKECLEKIAILMKRGPYLLKYSLKPEYRALRNQEKARLAQLAGSSTSKDQNNDSDLEELEMEDVA